MHRLDSKTISKIKRSRGKGLSYRELTELFSLPKSVIWYHVHEVKIRPQYLQIWKAKRGGSAKRSAKRWEIARSDARIILRSNKREMAIIWAMLYWAEGRKKSEFALVNTDPAMIRLYLYIIRNVLFVPDNMIVGVVRIFTGMNQQASVRYWSKVTGIPKSLLRVRLNDGGNHGRTQFGLCRISVRKGAYYHKLVHCVIDGVIGSISTSKKI